ncbi:hypothetical protein CRD_02139 [Raphidiopsis brookii D9]|nr:hypothetical protein CRD_02139 [Raphidiopsis brookii D9]
MPEILVSISTPVKPPKTRGNLENSPGDQLKTAVSSSVNNPPYWQLCYIIVGSW